MKKRDVTPPLRAILFDFDGVLLESADIKTQAYRELFAGYPGFQKKILDYHRRHAGISRFNKFDHIFRKILRKPLTSEKRRRLGRIFSALVYKKVLACPYVLGAENFFKKYAGRVALFVVSGTPQPELRRIVGRRGLRPFFRDVYGSPPGKGELILRVLRTFRFKPSETLFVGDALTDWRAAALCRVPFVARVPPGRPSLFPRTVRRVRDLMALDALVRGRLKNGGI